MESHFKSKLHHQILKEDAFNFSLIILRLKTSLSFSSRSSHRHEYMHQEYFNDTSVVSWLDDWGKVCWNRHSLPYSVCSDWWPHAIQSSTICLNIHWFGCVEDWPAASVVACGNNSAIVAQFEYCDHHIVQSYYALDGFSKTEVHRKVRSKNVWYGAIDGNYRHRAIVLHMDSNNQWKNFCWMVKVTKSGFPTERY